MFEGTDELSQTLYSCYVCNKKIHRKPYHIKKFNKTGRLHCSVKCHAISKRELMAGNSNHQYNLLGELNGTFKSDIKMNSWGYIQVRCTTHPFRNHCNFVMLHRLVVEEKLRLTNNCKYLCIKDGQRVLKKNIDVHHINENRIDNRLSNLNCLTREEHMKIHHKPKKKDYPKNGRYVANRDDIKLFRKHTLDAGQDVMSNENCIVLPKSSYLVSTGLTIALPNNHVGLLWSRSGLSVKHKIEVGAGCLDENYRGEVKVHLYNFSDVPFEIKIGDRIAQLLTMPINKSNFQKVENLDETDRGDDGFGSTGGYK